MFFLPPPLLHSPTVPTPPEPTSTLCSHLTQPIRSAAPNAPLLLALHSVPHPSSHVIACISLSFPISSIYASQFRQSTSFCLPQLPSLTLHLPTPLCVTHSTSSPSTVPHLMLSLFTQPRYTPCTLGSISSIQHH